jgi:anti-sigma B factor antagonist/stage II sporulation protein AA (anti-sigma F factor antagonist)
MAIGLTIELEEIDKVVILRLDGRLDAATAPILDRKIQTLVADGRLQIALDFAYVDYLSSAGMRVLLSESRKLQGKQGTFVLFSLSSEVEEVLKMAGFDRILHIFPTEKEALQFKK